MAFPTTPVDHTFDVAGTPEDSTAWAYAGSNPLRNVGGELASGLANAYTGSKWGFDDFQGDCEHYIDNTTPNGSFGSNYAGVWLVTNPTSSAPNGYRISYTSAGAEGNEAKLTRIDAGVEDLTTQQVYNPGGTDPTMLGLDRKNTGLSNGVNQEVNGYLEVSGLVSANLTFNDNTYSGTLYRAIDIYDPGQDDVRFDNQGGGEVVPEGPDPQTIDITNTGGGTLNWTATKTETWLSLSPSSGSTTAETDQITVSINPTGLADGVYTDTITITDAGATNSPQTVDVTLNIGAADTVAPIINLTTPLTHKMSDESGKDAYSYSFSVNEDIQAWKIKVVSSTSDPHTAGTQVESGGAATSGQTISGSITYAELVAAGVGSEGQKRLAFFAQDTAGNWSVTT